MIKKSLGMALLSASLLTMAACSSDDDDDSSAGTTDDATTTTGGEGTTTEGEGTATGEGTTTDGGEGTTTDGGEGTTTDGGEGTTTDGGEGTTTGEGGDTDGNPANLTPGGYLPGTLTALIEENGGLAALQALAGAGLDLALNDAGNAWTVFLPTDAALAAFEGDVNVQTHIYLEGAPQDSTAVTGLVGSALNMNDGSSQQIAGGGAEPLSIGGANIVTPDLSVPPGTTIVHLIDAVLVGN